MADDKKARYFYPGAQSLAAPPLPTAPIATEGIEEIKDTQPPTVQVFVSDIAVATNQISFSARFIDNRGIDNASIAQGDITVTGPNNFNETPTLYSKSPTTDATVVAAILSLDAGFTHESNGQYSIVLATGKVKDLAGNEIAGGVIGSFQCAVPVPAPDDPDKQPPVVTITNVEIPGPADEVIVPDNAAPVVTIESVELNGRSLSQESQNVTYSFAGLSALPDGWLKGDTAVGFEAKGVRVYRGEPHKSYLESPRFVFPDQASITLDWETETEASMPAIAGDPNLFDLTDNSLWMDDGGTNTASSPKDVRIILRRIGGALETTSYRFEGGQYVQKKQKITALGNAAFDNFYVYIDAPHESLLVEQMKIEVA